MRARFWHLQSSGENQSINRRIGLHLPLDDRLRAHENEWATRKIDPAEVKGPPQAVDVIEGFQVFRPALSSGIARVDEYPNHSGCRRHIAQYFQPLCLQFGRDKAGAGDVAAGPVKAGGRSRFHRIAATHRYYRNRRGCYLRREGRHVATAGDDHGDLLLDQVSREHRQSVVLALRPTKFNRHVLTVDVTRLVQIFAKAGDSTSMILKLPSSHRIIPAVSVLSGLPVEP
jgi:hypothetical protein